MNFEIEQRLLGSQDLRQLCARLAPESTFEDIANMTGHLAAHGEVKKATKILHHRPGGTSRYVLEIYEAGGAAGDRYVILTINRDFDGKDALAIYRHFKTL